MLSDAQIERLEIDSGVDLAAYRGQMFGDGIRDDTRWIQHLLSSGASFELPPRQVYLVRGSATGSGSVGLHAERRACLTARGSVFIYRPNLLASGRVPRTATFLSIDAPDVVVDLRASQVYPYELLVHCAGGRISSPADLLRCAASMPSRFSPVTPRGGSGLDTGESALHPPSERTATCLSFTGGANECAVYLPACMRSFHTGIEMNGGAVRGNVFYGACFVQDCRFGVRIMDGEEAILGAPTVNGFWGINFTTQIFADYSRDFPRATHVFVPGREAEGNYMFGVSLDSYPAGLTAPAQRRHRSVYLNGRGNRLTLSDLGESGVIHFGPDADDEWVVGGDAAFAWLDENPDTELPVLDRASGLVGELPLEGVRRNHVVGEGARTRAVRSRTVTGVTDYEGMGAEEEAYWRMG